MENLFYQIANSELTLLAVALVSLTYFCVTYYSAWKVVIKQKKLEELKPKAIELFKDAYGKTPKEEGFPVIGLYEKQSAYLYATSETVIKSYKTQQNIIRWLMLWYLWPWPVAFCGTTMTMIKYTSFTHPSFIAWCFFTAFWAILGFILIGRALLASRSVKFGKNVTYLNY